MKYKYAYILLTNDLENKKSGLEVAVELPKEIKGRKQTEAYLKNIFEVCHYSFKTKLFKQWYDPDKFYERELKKYETLKRKHG